MMGVLNRLRSLFHGVCLMTDDAGVFCRTQVSKLDLNVFCILQCSVYSVANSYQIGVYKHWETFHRPLFQ